MDGKKVEILVSKQVVHIFTAMLLRADFYHSFQTAHSEHAHSAVRSGRL
jgi:hypothetical protein